MTTADQDRRANVEWVNGFFGPEWRCRAGQAERPEGCERHSEHYWCKVCGGWYGVPHDGLADIHTGPNAHPNHKSWMSGCVCLPCRQDPLGQRHVPAPRSGEHDKRRGVQ